MLSLRQVVQDTFGISNLSQGVRARLWDDFYSQHPTAFPFQNAQSRQSLFQTLVHWDTWPKAADFTSTATYPDNKVTPYSQNIQGVTHSEFYWMFSLRERELMAWPVGQDLDSNLSQSYTIQASSTQLPAGYNHYGDSDSLYVSQADRWLTVTAVEGSGEPNCFVFHSFQDPGPTPQSGPGGWSFLGYRVIAAGPQVGFGTNASWAVFNPGGSLMYSSTFNTDHIQVYRYSNAVAGSTLELPNVTWLGDDGIKIKHSSADTTLELKRVQGGVVSSNMRLYVTVDRDLSEQGGIYGIDLVSGANLLYLPSGGGDVLNEELQGQTLWNVDPFNPPGVNGQLHLVVLNNGITDRVSLRHWSANAAVITHL